MIKNNNETNISYDNFNYIKYIKTIKEKFNIAIYLCKFKKTNLESEFSDNNKKIIKELKLLLKNPIIYKNQINNILIEIEIYLDNIRLFIDIIKSVKTIDGMAMRQNKLLEIQSKSYSNLKKINNNPEGSLNRE